MKKLLLLILLTIVAALWFTTLSTAQQPVRLHGVIGCGSFMGATNGIRMYGTAGLPFIRPSDGLSGGVGFLYQYRRIVEQQPDHEEPITLIVSGPESSVETDSVTFTWTGSDNLTETENLVFSFMLSEYDEGFSDFYSDTMCSYTNLANGIYTFYVRAHDEAGNVDSTPDSLTFTVAVSAPVDTTAPETLLSSAPPEESNITTVTFIWTGTDDITATKNLVFACRLDPIEDEFSSFASDTLKEYTGLSFGTYTFYVQAMDEEGNVDTIPAVYTFIIAYLTPPDFTIGILQNPVTTHFIDIYTIPGETLLSSPAVTLNGIPYILEQTDTSPDIYKTAYQATGTEDITIIVEGQDIFNNTRLTSRSFTITKIVPAQRIVASSFNREFTVEFAPESFLDEVFVLIQAIEEQDIVSPYIFSYKVKCGGKSPQKDVRIEARIPDNFHDTHPGKHLRFQRRDGNIWKNCKTVVHPERGSVSTISQKLGEFRLLVADNDEKITTIRIPREFRLFQNAPNPFNPGTFITYEIPGENRIQLEIYNVIGQLVRTFRFVHFSACSKTIWWDGCDDRGNAVSSGIYFCRFIAEGHTQTIKMLLSK